MSLDKRGLLNFTSRSDDPLFGFAGSMLALSLLKDFVQSGNATAVLLEHFVSPIDNFLAESDDIAQIDSHRLEVLTENVIILK